MEEDINKRNDYYLNIYPEHVHKSMLMASNINVIKDSPCYYNLIATHDGPFHCDEILAICLLQFIPEFSNSSKM